MSIRDEYGMIADEVPEAPLKAAQRPLRDEARAKVVRLAMRRLRRRRQAAGLNWKNEPLKPENRKYINKKWL
jgi:hypothetical protein